MAADHNVRIVEWPSGPARLHHSFDEKDPLPALVNFAPAPAHVVVAAPPERPLVVAMGMNLSVKQPLPVCIRLCEPICVDSDYVIGITLFDRPIISITVKGRTRIFNCGEEL
jgi:hypothetical protein